MTCPSCWGNSDGCCTRVEKIANEAGAGYVFMDCHPYTKSGLVGCAGHPSVAGHAMMAGDIAPVVRKVTGW